MKQAIRKPKDPQLRDVHKPGKIIQDGEVDLSDHNQPGWKSGEHVTLVNADHDEMGKGDKRKNRKHEDSAVNVNQEDHPSKKMKSSQYQTTLCFIPISTNHSHTTTHLAAWPSSEDTFQHPNNSSSTFISSPAAPELGVTLHRIDSHPTLTPYRKRLYRALLSVPRGRHTTYAALSDYLNSSARAVGNGMRNNPFAPDVPCHRVLAADGSLGGFQGDWGKDGKHASKKIDLLREEGVKFDSRGKVKGAVFRSIHNFEDAMMKKS